MDYRKIYDSLMNHRKRHAPSGYSEKHHILPRCVGGKDSKDNLVRLSAREHYIAHKLLCRIYENDTVSHRKLIYAYACMVWRKSPNQSRYKVNAREYSRARQVVSEVQRNRMLQNNHMSGKSHSETTKQKISQACKNVPILDKAHLCNKCRRKAQAQRWYSLFLEADCSAREFVIRSDYDKSHVAFIKMLKKYVPEYAPKQGISGT